MTAASIYRLVGTGHFEKVHDIYFLSENTRDDGSIENEEIFSAAAATLYMGASLLIYLLFNVH